MAKKPSLREVAESASRDRILSELRMQHWNVRATAVVLGMSRQGLYDACKRLRINVRREQARSERSQ